MLFQWPAPYDGVTMQQISVPDMMYTEVVGIDATMGKLAVTAKPDWNAPLQGFLATQQKGRKR
jgi:hypothetical protein